MNTKRPKRDPIAAHARKTKASLQVGGDGQCACGESRPRVLRLKHGLVACAQCQQKKRGIKHTEDHHVAGAVNSPVKIPIPVNDHRAVLSEAQYDWPPETLQNRAKSPLLAEAAKVRGYLDTTAYLKESLLSFTPEMFEELDRLLTKRFGRKWWKETPLENFAPKGRSNDRKKHK